MKIFTPFLLAIVQLQAIAQPSQWDEQAIQANKVKEASIFWQSPNPKTAKQLRLKYWVAFDNKGKVTESRCKWCVARTHIMPPSADVIQKFTYENGRLAKIASVDFDSTTVLFYYDQNYRRLQITSDVSNNRIGVILDYLDKQERPTVSFDIDFENAYPEGDSVSVVFIYKTIIQYEDQKQTTKKYGTNELVNMGTTIPLTWFRVLQSSTDPAAIENAVNHLDLGFLTLYNTSITEKLNDRIQVIDADTGTVNSVFYLGTNGLIVKEETQQDSHKSASEYVYQHAQ